MVLVSTRRPAPALCGLAVAAALTCSLASAAHAQSIWLDHDHRASGLAEILFPNLKGADSRFPNWTWFVDGRFRVGPHTHLVAELPYTHADYGNSLASISEATLGNPYLGVEYAKREGGPLVEFGARVPVASDDKETAFVTGYLTDLERQEAFIPDALPLRLAVHAHHVPTATAGVAWDVRIAPSIWIKTNDKFLAETETFLGYGGTLRYLGRDVRAGAGFTGRWNLSSNGADLDRSTMHQAEFGLDFLHGSVRPGLALKLPVDHDLTEFVDKTWGFTLSLLPRSAP